MKGNDGHLEGDWMGRWMRRYTLKNDCFYFFGCYNHPQMKGP